jgi:hypothetical protein
MPNKNSDSCSHVWKLHIDAGKSGGPNGGHTFDECTKCHLVVTRLERHAYDTYQVETSSLKTQTKNSKISMIATVISAASLVIAALVFIFGTGLTTNMTDLVKTSIYNECFDYYAETEKESGISEGLIEVCVEKAERWTNNILDSNLTSDLAE